MKMHLIYGTALLMGLFPLAGAAGKPLKVNILAGQSNMQGSAYKNTI